ncbi:MAG: hypothetical protein ONB46_00335 [candidate division KSB1 bacterium]|nr:hypothetical protein [candidate division KSB1 bacterium]MDZ7364709.1 hypothetical protein [candidate division KSB1 bacterium]MDZ7402543.1 hypothetical protein [candidate division KSB1 bacterium]
MRVFLIILFLFFSFLPLQAQVSTPFDTARMQRDLGIMNVILDRLMFNVPGHYLRLGGEATRSIYLPDYGVIFLMPRRPDTFSFFNFSPQGRSRVEVHQQSGEAGKKSKSGARGGVAYEYSSEGQQNLKEPLIEFFSKYADAIGQLDESERIVIYWTGGRNIFYSFGEGWEISSRSGAEAGNKDLLAIARKTDIVALRTGKLKAGDFASRLIFKDIATEPTDSEIDIMARIIDTAWGGRSRQAGFHSNHSRGIYLDDFGVIFFTQASFGHDFSLRIWQDVETRSVEESLQRRILALQNASEQRRENWAAQYKKFKQQLAEVIADYGHTLRQLKPQDNIVITADLDNAMDGSPAYLVCRVKKQHVEAFNARRISREQLMKLVSYAEY